VEYLGYNNEVHIQGDYYMDVDNLQHKISFSLSQDSLFRMYAEPHWIDIDFHLLEVLSDGSTTYVQSEISIGQEEVIFRLVPGGTTSKPRNYIILIKYFPWNRGNRPVVCETFNFELAIQPTQAVKQLTNKMNNFCAQTDKYPAPAGAGVGDSSYYAVGASGLSYNPTGYFTVHSNASNLNLNKTSQDPNYFYKFMFSVAPLPGQAALITAEAGYQFLPGAVTVMLEEMTSNHCGRQAANADECISGANLLNRNRLNKAVLAGNYTLWLYEAYPQLPNISQCSIYNFNLSITYIPLADDNFYCNNAPFPKTLNGPGFIESDGYLHIRESFLAADAEMTFNLTKSSAMRVHAVTNVFLTMKIWNVTTHQEISASVFSAEPELFVVLPPGYYSLTVYTFFVQDSTCPTINMEMLFRQ